MTVILLVYIIGGIVEKW